MNIWPAFFCFPLLYQAGSGVVVCGGGVGRKGMKGKQGRRLHPRARIKTGY